MVRDFLGPELFAAGIVLVPTILLTGTKAGGPSGRGGVSRWAKIEKDVRLRLASTPHWAAVTTLLDYYGLPQDSPGMADRSVGPARQRVEYVEQCIAARIDHSRFLPYLVLHEAETWVLAAAEQLGVWVEDSALAGELKRQIDAAGGPEYVNDGSDSAPSKRLLKLYPAYNKTQDGPAAVADLGLSELRAACPHFDAWIGRLLALTGESTASR